MKIVISILGLLLPFIANANMELYYSHINKADSYIITNDYPKALQYYDDAFKAVPKEKIFVRDLYNHSLCVLSLGQDNNFEEDVFLMAQNGCPKTLFYNKFYRKFFDKTAFDKKYGGFFDKGHAIFKNNQNAVLVQEYKQLINAIDSLSDNALSNRNFSLKLEEFIQKNGFPTENQVGVAVTDSNLLTLSPITQVLSNYSAGFKQSTIEKLIAEVQNGNMHNMDSFFFRRRLGYYTFEAPYLVYKCNIYKSKMIVDKSFFMNNQRIIGLRTKQEHAAIMYYGLTQNTTGFSLKYSTSQVGSFKDAKAEQETLELYEKMPLNVKDCIE